MALCVGITGCEFIHTAQCTYNPEVSAKKPIVGPVPLQHSIRVDKAGCHRISYRFSMRRVPSWAITPMKQSIVLDQCSGRSRQLRQFSQWLLCTIFEEAERRAMHSSMNCWNAI